MRFLNFLKYNNIFPVSLSLILLSFGGAMAASPDVRGEVAASVYDKEEQVVGVDNTYLLDLDLEEFSPSIKITNITEDSDSYFVAYTFHTVGLKDNVWQELVRTETQVVPKSFLVSLNLGQYLSGYFDELTRKEMVLLSETKDIEKIVGRTSQKVTTKYKGLIGKLFDAEERAIPGYEMPEIQEEEVVVLVQNDRGDEGGGEGGVASPLPSSEDDGESPVIAIIGENPQMLSASHTYIELGVLVTDADTPTQDVVLDIQSDVDTELAGQYTVRYVATDPEGHQTIVERQVVVLGSESESLEESSSSTEESEEVLFEDESDALDPEVSTEPEVPDASAQ